MGKIFQKKSDTQNDAIIIDAESVEPLFRTERWSESGAKSTSSNALSGDVATDLCAQPNLSAQSVDISRLTQITSDDIIDKFLRSDSHRIVAE